ncbi:hypothetical protein SAMN05443633_10383 [Chryseobacterium arachidis]|uniref:Uncharacterized protein n=1 Tax=Chryseobacterium arachidis TaxID=1416778 RepID=A0A1M4Z8T6_9FLAO|nr:hypothetical protein SAMN05443633_10383 [Chryseobacterium arachidis]
MLKEEQSDEYPLIPGLNYFRNYYVWHRANKSIP